LSATVPDARATDLPAMSATEIGSLQQRLTDARCYAGAIDGQASPTLQAAIEACPSQDPVLRIETGMHVATSKRIGVDRACRIAATSSEDKTVRVWSLPEGRLIRILRVPIGPGNGGKIYATAVSPDGRWVAAGGWDARWEATHEHFVYVFEASTGALVSRAGPFGDVIDHLVFSPDGRWLAATSFAGVGLKVIDTQTWRIAAEDRAYADQSWGAAFGPDGRLYTVAYDGKLRKYGPGPAFKKEREVLTTGGRRPYSVAIDPKGQLIGLGFDDSRAVDIYDAATLRFRSAADVSGLDKGNDGNLFAVGWTSDGTRLIAGGMYAAIFRNHWTRPLLFFDRGGQRVGGLLPLSDNTILNLQPCGNAIAVSAFDPAFGLIGAEGQIGLWKTGVAPDMRGKIQGAFTIAPNSKEVRFGLGVNDANPVLFDLGQATVTSAPNPLPGFIAPLVEALPVSNWYLQFNPTFAGKPIALEQHERSLSVAIRPDSTGFVLGAEWHLRAFDAQGRQIWQRPAPGVAWGVNFSADGRIIVAAYGDGTIRWLRWSDGRELLALFVNRDTKAWVAWTPSGYYMASPGGEDLIGWHVNRGWDQAADFFPASRFRDRFNRPDIVHLALDTLDEDAAIKQANATSQRKEDTRPLTAHLPPIIRVVEPADGTHVQNGRVTLNYSLRSPSGQPVERIDVLIDGRPVKAVGLPIRPMASNIETQGSVDITLTQRLTEVGLIAWGNSAASETARIRLNWDGAPAPVEARRKLRALVVGVSNYVAPDMALSYAAKDARDFGQALQNQKGGYYTDVETRVLTDRDVTRSSVLSGLAWLEKSATGPDDVSVLFLAGHGLTDEKQTYWFFPSDANADDIRTKGVSQDEVRKSLQNLSGKVLWFLDTCHAGSAAKRRSVDVNVLVNTVSSSENGGIIVFASSTGRQVSVERDDWGNGAFTKAIVEGIELGKADLLGKGFITTSSLDTFVESRVAELTEGKQSPVMERPPQQPDFAIAEAHKR